MGIIKKLEVLLFNKIKIYNIFFVIIFAAGFFLRLDLFIYNPSLCTDEAGLALYLIKAPTYMSFFIPSADIPFAPPLFFIFAKFFYNFFDLRTISPMISDFMLRIVPFVSGVLLIPAFGALVYKVFKNRFITSVGMLFVALYPLCITFSVNFRQYSLESLITVLIMLITLSINLEKDSLKKKLLKFGLLSLMPLFSLTSVLILPFSMLYLFVNSVQCKTLKKYLFCVGMLLYIQVLYYFVFFHGVISTNYNNMITFWSNKSHGNYLYVMYISLCCVLFSKNLKKILLYGGPVFLTMILILFKKYPYADCTLLFILPLVVISFLFISEFISRKMFNKYKLAGVISIIFATIVLLLVSPTSQEYRYQEEYGREVWSAMMHLYGKKIKTPILYGGSYKTNAYYNYIYNIDHINAKDVLNDKNWGKLPDGNHYLIITNMDETRREYEFLLSRYDVYISDIAFHNPKSCYIRFKKIFKTKPQNIQKKLKLRKQKN